MVDDKRLSCTFCHTLKLVLNYYLNHLNYLIYLIKIRNIEPCFRVLNSSQIILKEMQLRNGFLIKKLNRNFYELCFYKLWAMYRFCNF